MSWKAKLGVWLVLLTLTGLPLSMFVVQNLDRTVGLSFNGGFFATELAQPMPLPYLLGIFFGVGLLFGWILNSIRRWRANRPASASGSDYGASGAGDDWV